MTRAIRAAILILAGWLLPFSGGAVFEGELLIETIPISITHPGFESDEPEEHDIEVRRDSQGIPRSYGMAVRSVFCSDEKCDVIVLQMEWDALGRYLGYAVPEGEALTKYDHEPFEPEDYARFDRLIDDAASILGTVRKHEIIVRKKKMDGKSRKPGTKANPEGVAGKADVLQKVDGMSGATATYIKEEVVEGAAYTCFTMWHWANGDTATRIREFSQENGPEPWLVSLLDADEPASVDFAIEGLIRRELFSEAVRKRAQGAAGGCSEEGFKQLVSYMEMADAQSGNTYSAHDRLIRDASGRRRVYVLERMLNKRDVPPLAFFESVAKELKDFKTFYEIQLYLALAEKHGLTSIAVYEAVAELLTHDNFFIARRVHEYLKPKQVPESVGAAISAFEKRHEDRLSL